MLVVLYIQFALVVLYIQFVLVVMYIQFVLVLQYIHFVCCTVHTVGEKCMSVQHVRKWCREFTGGRTDIHEEERSERPSVSDETIEKVEGILLEDRRITKRGGNMFYIKCEVLNLLC